MRDKLKRSELKDENIIIPQPVGKCYSVEINSKDEECQPDKFADHIARAHSQVDELCNLAHKDKGIAFISYGWNFNSLKNGWKIGPLGGFSVLSDPAVYPLRSGFIEDMRQSAHKALEDLFLDTLRSRPQPRRRHLIPEQKQQTDTMRA